LLAYSPASDNESTPIQGQIEGGQSHNAEDRQIDLTVEQQGKADKRAMRRPRRIA